MRESVSIDLHLADTEATTALGSALADVLPDDLAGWSVLLAGDLGAGKSTLARAVLRRLGHHGPVPSPTYTLVEPYEFARNIVYHVDLYRINREEELQFLGFSELDNGLLLIEWPDRVDGLEERSDLAIELSIAGHGRSAHIRALSERSVPLLRGLARP